MIVFVDGENFRQNLANELCKKHLIQRRDTLFKYDVVGLLREALMVDDIEVWYYASEVKMPRGHEPDPEIVKQMHLIDERAKHWVPMLKEQDVRYIHAGNLKPKTSVPCRVCGSKQEIIQEKGVDVRMALDIFEYCLDPEHEEIAVMSSDVDMCPVYRKAYKHGVKVRYVCFADRMNLALKEACYKTMTISPDNVKHHFEGVMPENSMIRKESEQAAEDFVYEN